MAIKSILDNYGAQVRGSVKGQARVIVDRAINGAVENILSGPGSVAETPGQNTLFPTHGYDENPMLKFVYILYLPDMKFGPEYVAAVSPEINTIAVETTMQQGSPANYAGKRNVGSFSVAFNEDDSATVLRYFERWRRDMVSDDSVYSPAAKYKKNIRLYIVDRSGEGGVEMIAEKAFPTSIRGYEFNVEDGSGHVKPVITFSIDNLYLQFYNAADIPDDPRAASSVFPGLNIPGVGPVTIPLPSVPRPSDILRTSIAKDGGVRLPI